MVSQKHNAQSGMLTYEGEPCSARTEYKSVKDLIYTIYKNCVIFKKKFQQYSVALEKSPNHFLNLAKENNFRN